MAYDKIVRVRGRLTVDSLGPLCQIGGPTPRQPVLAAETPTLAKSRSAEFLDSIGARSAAVDRGDAQSLTIDLSGVNWIDLDAIAALVALLPRLGGIYPSINLVPPGPVTGVAGDPGATERLKRDPLQFLSNLHLDDILAEVAETFHVRLGLTTKLPPRWSFSRGSQPLPLMLITETHYAHEGRGFEEDPRLTGVLAEKVSQAFSELGVRFSYEHMQALSTWLREAGWNAVVHSQLGICTGWAILGLQMRSHLEPAALDFVLIDSGIGVQASLSDAFDQFVERLRVEGRDADVARWTGWSRAEAILRFAFSDYGTRRADRSGRRRRGLGKMLDMVRGGGTLTLASGETRLSSGPNATSEGASAEAGSAWSGTIVSGRLLQPTRDRAPGDSEREGGWLQSRRHVIALVSADGRYDPRDATNQVDELLASWVNEDPEHPYSTLVIDCGFAAELHERDLVAIVKKLANVRAIHLCIWNFPRAPELLGEVAGAATLASGFRGLPPLVATGRFNAYVIGLGPGDAARVTSCYDWYGIPQDARVSPETACGKLVLEVALPVRETLHVDRQVNSALLREGFENGTAEAGFYRGGIRLLDGGVATRFLAMQHLLDHYSHRERFVNSILRQILGTTLEGRNASETVILGFASSAFKLARDVATALGARGILLHPYAVPQQEEIAASLAGGTQVILVTDVVSSGSLMASIAEAVQRAGGNVLLQVAAAHSRGSDDVTPLDCEVTSDFVRRPAADADIVAVTLEIDPVTIVPRPISAADHSHARLTRSLELLATTGAVSFGHLKVTERHSSAVIDIEQLVTAGRVELKELLAREYRVIAAPDTPMSEFRPSAVVLPAVGTRLELLTMGANAGRIPHSYRRATEAVYTLVSEICPPADGDIAPMIAARQYDAGGRPEVALTPREGLTLRGRDVLLIDDGLASGATLGQVLRAVCGSGAARVWAIALCSRAPLREAEYWEGIAAMHVEGALTPVRITVPVLFPVPFHQQEACPLEHVAAPLADLTEGDDAIATEASAVVKELAVRDWELVDDTWTSIYTRARLQCHVFAQLADHDGWARDQLEAMLGRIAANLTAHPPITAELIEVSRAVLEVFSDEPSILSRARFRKTIEPLVRSIARRVVALRAMPLAVRRAGLVVIRAGQHSDLELALGEELVSKVADSPELLARLAFQLYTLVRQHRIPHAGIRAAHEVVGFAEALLEGDPANEASARALQIALTTTLVSAPAPGTGDLLLDIQEAANALLLREKKDHFVDTALAILGGVDATTPPLGASTPDLASKIGNLRGLMERRVVPPLSALNQQFVSAPSVTPLEEWPAGTEAYLASVLDERNGALPLDLRTLALFCSGAPQAVPGFVKAEVGKAANRIRASLFSGKSSSAIAVLESWINATVHDLVADLEAEVRLVIGRLPGVRVDVNERGIGRAGIVGPRPLYQELFSLWAGNLLKAFPVNAPRSAHIVIDVSRADVSNVSHHGVRISLLDNGVGLNARDHTSSTTVHQRERCRVFGANLSSAKNRADSAGCIVSIELREVHK